MSFRISTISNKIVNLLTFQSLIDQSLLSKAAQTTKDTILTTVEYDTHIKYRMQLNQLTKNPHIRVVPFYSPLVYKHYQFNNLVSSDLSNPPNVSLLIGDNNQQFIQSLDQNQILTLQELCKAFPEKVPLSYRNKNCLEARQKLLTRFGSFNSNKVIQFKNIFIISPYIQMWDEAFQVILDCQPTPVYIPYLKSRKDDLYRLTLVDFINGLMKTHATVSTAVKTHPPLNLVQFTQQTQLNWIISQIANNASQMTIDRNFFTEPPKVHMCSGSVKIISQLHSVL